MIYISCCAVILKMIPFPFSNIVTLSPGPHHHLETDVRLIEQSKNLLHAPPGCDSWSSRLFDSWWWSGGTNAPPVVPIIRIIFIRSLIMISCSCFCSCFCNASSRYWRSSTCDFCSCALTLCFMLFCCALSICFILRSCCCRRLWSSANLVWMADSRFRTSRWSSHAHAVEREEEEEAEEEGWCTYLCPCPCARTRACVCACTSLSFSWSSSSWFAEVRSVDGRRRRRWRRRRRLVHVNVIIPVSLVDGIIIVLRMVGFRRLVNSTYVFFCALTFNNILLTNRWDIFGPEIDT